MAAWRNDTGRHGVLARATLTPPAIGAASADHSPRTRADDGRRERAFSDGEPLNARFSCASRYGGPDVPYCCAMASARFVGGPLDGRSILNTPGDIVGDDGIYRFDERTQNYVWFAYRDGSEVAYSGTVHIRPKIDDTTTR